MPGQSGTLELAAHVGEELVEHLLIGAADFHLHLDAAQEGVVDQVVRVEVGAET